MAMSRRALLWAGGGLAAAHVTPARAAEGTVAIIMNSADASVSVIDMATGTEVRRVPLLREPHHWALSADGKHLLVGDSGANALFMLDPNTGEVVDRQACADPYQLWTCPNRAFLVVNALRLDRIDIYDAGTRKLVKRFAEPSMPSHLAYSPDGAMVFSTLQKTGQVVAISLKTMAVTWRAKVGPAPAGVVWHGDRLLVAIMGSDHVAEIDPLDGRVIRRVTTGRGAHIIYPSPDRRLLFVGNRVGGTISALDAATLKPERTYELSGGPDCIAFAPNGRMWVTRRFTSSVAVMDPENGKYDLVATGRSPHGIFLSSVLAAAQRDPVAALGTASL